MNWEGSFYNGYKGSKYTFEEKNKFRTASHTLQKSALQCTP